MALKWAIFITQPEAGLFAEQTKKRSMTSSLPRKSKLESHACIVGAGGVGRCRYQREVALEIVVEVEREHTAVGVVGAE